MKIMKLLKNLIVGLNTVQSIDVRQDC